MTNEDKKDLLDEGAQLAYQYATLSGVNGNKTNQEADVLAEEWAIKIDSLLQGLINEEFTRIEAAAQRADERRVA